MFKRFKSLLPFSQPASRQLSDELNSDGQVAFSNKFVWAFALIFLTQLVSAQQTVGGLTQIVEQIKLIGNVIFIGAIVWAAVRTVIAFATSSPNAMTNVMYTLGIALFWFGFNYFVEDIATTMGGAGAGDYNR